MGARATIALAMVLVAGPSFAERPWPDTLTPDDRARIERFEETRSLALVEAGSGDPASIGTLNAVISGIPVPIAVEAITGEWQCRTVKLGKTLPLVVYTWFACTIENGERGLMLHKVSGSQRTRGTLRPLGDGRYGYAGGGYYSDEEPGAYGVSTERNEVGLLVRLDDGRMRLELPRPVFESLFDILEFRRAP